MDLINKWKQVILGTPYDAADKKVKQIIEKKTGKAKEIWDGMNKARDRDYLWEHVKSRKNPEQLHSISKYLLEMATAYAMPGSSLEKDPILLQDLIGALDWFYEEHYHAGKQAYGNWWPWEIGIPLRLNDITILLYDELGQERIKKYMDAIEYFQPDPRYSGANAKGTTAPHHREATGGNRVDICKVVAIRGAIMRQEEKIALASQAIQQVFEYVTEKDGFYEDGSFIQHGNIPYTGTYGNVLLRGVVELLLFLKDTPWEMKGPHVERIYQWVLTSFAPFLYKGAVMDMVSGRSVTRKEGEYGQGDHGRGREIIHSILLLCQSAPTSYAQEYQALIKYMIQSDTFVPYLERIEEIGLYQLAKKIVEDPAIPAKKPENDHKQFPNMDRVVHHQKDFAFGIASHSTRTGNYEGMNGENVRGWYSGDGMTYLYNGDLSHYTDYWITVYPYRMPGTTEDTEIRKENSGQNPLGRSWVGGTWIGTNGIWGMDFASWDESLTAKKGWFLFQDKIIALGAGISSQKKGVRVETIVENRKFFPKECILIFYGNHEEEHSFTWEKRETQKTNWVHVTGPTSHSDIGYYFPTTGSLCLDWKERTGSYKALYDPTVETFVTHHYFEMWLDHGQQPCNDSYAYVILPNRSKEETKGYGAHSDFEILSNTKEVQAVYDQGLKILGILFWENKKQQVDFITCDHQAAVMIQEEGDHLTIAISDPTMENEFIDLKINRKACKVLFYDSNIQVDLQEESVGIRVYVKGLRGQRSRITIKTLV